MWFPDKDTKIPRRFFSSLEKCEYFNNRFNYDDDEESIFFYEENYKDSSTIQKEKSNENSINKNTHKKNNLSKFRKKVLFFNKNL